MENWTVFGIFFLVICLVAGFLLGALIRVNKPKRLRAEEIEKEMRLVLREITEPVFDSVPLEEAELTKGEKYLLASCIHEQFQQLEATRRPVKLGYFTKENWRGGLPFYLFKCPNCLIVGVDYKHGLHPYLTCEKCQTATTFDYFFLTSLS